MSESSKVETHNHIHIAQRIAGKAAEYKAGHIKAYDVQGLTVVTDCFFLCTAASKPQMKAIYNAVREAMRDAGVEPLHTEGDYGDGWLVLDYGLVLVHIFREEAWEFYDLEGLWGDAPEIDLKLAA